MRVGLYRLSNRLLELGEALMAFKRAVHNGLWLGVLDREHLHRVDRAVFSGLVSYTGAEHHLRGLFEWEERVIDDHLADAKEVLVLAAGGGREVIALLGRGCSVDGFECNPDLVDSGNRLLAERGAKTRIGHCERDRCPPLERTYDAVIVGWSSYMFIQGRSRRIRLLADLRAHLVPAGKVLVSFFYRRGGERRFLIATRLANPLRRLRGVEAIELGDSLAPNFVHFFIEDEVRSEFEEAGYRMLCYRTAGYGHAVGVVDSPAA